MKKGFAVVGLSYGDEGKGLVTDYLCSQLPARKSLVVRYSGGQQAGHTVVCKGVRHVFSNFGSGTLRGVPSCWAPYCTVDPIGLINEQNSLAKKLFVPVIEIDPTCPVTTPYDIACDQKNQEVSSTTCGVGFGKTLQREEDKFSLIFYDLFYPKVLKIKLKLIETYYRNIHNVQSIIPIDEFLYACNEITKAWNIGKLNGNSLLEPKYIIFESSQGLLLDKSIGFFPYVTRSHVGTKNLPVGLDVYYVTRAYQTRHGIGPLTNEELPNNIKIDVNETNITNKYQGEFRRALLDINMLQYALEHDRVASNRNHLVITCLDHIKDEYRFTHNNEIVYCNDENDFIRRVQNLLDFKKVFISKTPEAKNIIRYT